jgi:tRNA pseudouridine65 synthase
MHLHVHRLLLHAWRLELTHPLSANALAVSAPLDAEWLRVIDRFGWREALPEGAVAAC